VTRAAQVQSRRADDVLLVPMHWRLGYHRVFAMGEGVPHGFGHFGFGGSGAWCDPSRGLSVALVLNSGVGTPMGDFRIWRLNRSIVRAADARRARIAA
jgi:CubicO group peptidase (beta-lactamase class C family)